MSVIPTVVLYVRIPIELRKRLEDVAAASIGGGKKGAVTDVAIRALDAGLDVLSARLETRTKIEPARRSSRRKS